MTTPHRTAKPNRKITLASLFVIGAAMVLSGAAMIVAPASAGAERVQGTTPVKVVQTPSDLSASENCSPGTMGLTRTIQNNASVFKVTITESSTPCTPINAIAVVYAMPGNGVAWPQNLLEANPFTISQAGVTEIIFEKDCDPVQFDIVTGATPQTIAPFGQWHGPLLFPLDLETSLQFWGNTDCNETTTTTGVTTTTREGETTTTTTTTTTTAATTTTTTSPPQVLGTTVTQATTTPAVVLSATATNPTTSSLAVTGFSSRDAGLIGGGLVLIGIGLMVEARRRLT